MQLDLDSIFSDARERYYPVGQTKGRESFLLFASYVEKKDSLHPYWAVLREREKLNFVYEYCLENADSAIKNYILNNISKFWLYLINYTEVCFSEYINGEAFYYVPSFIKDVIFLFGKLYISNIIRFTPEEKVIFSKLLKCEESKNYFYKFFKRIEDILEAGGRFYFPDVFSETGKDNITKLRDTVIKNIDKNIAGKRF